MSYSKVKGCNGKESSGLFKVVTATNQGYFGNATEKYITANGCVVWTQNMAGGRYWANGGVHTANAGCGPSACAIIASSISGYKVTVDEILATNYGQKTILPIINGDHGTGPSHLAGLFACSDSFECKSYAEKINQKRLDECLSKGGMAAFVSNCNGPYYTSGTGHWVVVCKKTDDGKYQLVDSAHKGSAPDRFKKKYTFAQLQGESKTQSIYVTYTGLGGANKTNQREFNVTKTSLGSYTTTAYCPCSICCGKYANGITATGTKAKSGWTIAVDPTVIPYGSYVMIDGHIYHAEDCGGAIKGRHIDIYFDTHTQAQSWGKQKKEVILLKGAASELADYADYVNNGGAAYTEDKESFTSTKVVSTEGSDGVKKTLFSVTKNGDWYNGYELYIQNYKGVMYQPVVLDGVTWTTQRCNRAGSLDFEIVKDDLISFNEGSAVQFKVNGDGVFYGYVFKKSRTKKGTIKVVAYDQLRYFKNKDSYYYTNKKASDLLKIIADNFKLTIGKIDDTEYIIPKRAEDNKDLFSIMQTAIDLTWDNTNTRYLLYDDFGSLQLRNTNNLRYDVTLDGNCFEDFDYESSIENSYNKIVMYQDNESGCREMKVYQDGSNISNWGVLQYTQKYDPKTEDADSLGRQLLKNYNVLGRKLKVRGVFGNIKMRAGAQLIVNLNLGDILINNEYMMVESATHKFKNDNYTMDLNLIKNGVFTA